MPYQRNWSWCKNCQGMFFDGYPQKGQCPGQPYDVPGFRRLGHDGAGSIEFDLTYDEPANSHAEAEWRYCAKCHGLFYNGGADKGVCPAPPHIYHDPGATIPWTLGSHAHEAAGYRFVLPHDVPATHDTSEWRRCTKCLGLFSATGPDSGPCPTGEGHEVDGTFTYAVEHEPILH